MNTSEVVCSFAAYHSPFVYLAEGPERQRSLCEDAAAARNETTALGLMCVLQARAEAHTAPRLQFE